MSKDDGVALDRYTQRWEYDDTPGDPDSAYAKDAHPDACIQLGISAERYEELLRCDECSAVCGEDDVCCPMCGFPVDPYSLDDALYAAGQDPDEYWEDPYQEDDQMPWALEDY